MNRIFAGMLTLLVLLGGCFSPFAAQEIETINLGDKNVSGGTYCFMGYVPQNVNALWQIAGDEWRKALADPRNDEIRDLARESVRDGVTYYAMNLGECFYVPPGIKAKVPLIPDTVVVAPSGDTNGDTIVERNGTEMKSSSSFLGLGIVLLLMITAVFLMIWRHRKEKAEQAEQAATTQEQRQWERNNPETSGPPIIEGGMDALPPELQIGIATERLQTVAARTFVANSKPREYRVVGDITRGVLNGTGLVEYDGVDPQERNFADTPAFQALMEHIPTGQRIHRFVLWACANGAWSNMIGGDGLTFTPDIDRNGLRMRMVPPIVSVTSADVSRYGEPEYDPRHDLVAAGVLRPDTIEHMRSDLPRRSRVFMS